MLRRGIYSSGKLGGVPSFDFDFLNLPGTDEYASAADSADWNFGTDNFTFGWDGTFDSFSGFNLLMGQFQDANNRMIFYVNSSKQIGFFLQSGGSSLAH